MILHCTSYLLVAGALATATLAPVCRPRASGARPQTPTERAIEIPLAPYHGALRTVTGRIGELEAPFLFDTGGGATILSAATAKRAGCTPFGRGTGFRHDGTRVDGARGTPVDLAIGSFARRGEVGVLDLDELLRGLPPVGGVASLETFAGRQLTIDLARDRLIVESAATLAARTKDAREIVIRVAHQAAGASLDVFVAVEGEHGPLWFELDSGNLAPVLVAPHAFEELGFAAPPSGETRALELKLARFGAVKCDVASKEMIYDGLFNADFFLRHAVTLDLARARAWLRPNAEPAAREDQR